MSDMVGKMKVLEVFGEPISNGGQESFVINLLSHMNLENIEVDLMTPYYCDNMYYKKTVEDFGGKIVALGLEFSPGKNRFNINKYVDMFLKENKYDVVHIHSGSISILCILAYYAKKNGVKKVITHSHCAIENINMKNRILRIAGNFVMRKNVDFYCACSLVAGEAKYMPHIVKNEMIILNNGVDLKRFETNEKVRKNIRLKYNIEQNTFVIGHVGRFSYQKNHEYLIKIFNELLKVEKNAKLMLIGSGELEEEIKIYVKKLRIVNKVIFCGNVNNVHEYLQAMDIFLLPSRFEGLPIVGVEAQAAGLPIIVSDNVSDELSIGKSIEYLPLSESVQPWIEGILKYKGAERYNNVAELKEKGYDVDKTAAKVREIYFS